MRQEPRPPEIEGISARRRDVVPDPRRGQQRHGHEAPGRRKSRRIIEARRLDDVPVPPLGFRWQWRPADILLAMPPRDPRRAPLGPRHPGPAFGLVAEPATVVIDRPAERLLALPQPAMLLGVYPRPARIGPPVVVDIRDPHLAVARVIGPPPVRLEFAMEDLDVDLLVLRRGGRDRRDGHRHCQEQRQARQGPA